uniref:Alpha-1,3-glucosyltransferase n=1 Tax=Angiostrongylus cantonensis TaxID=6313 RepID=A0A158P7R4_ANGCA
LAIVHNLPLSEWYYDSTSEWTLDYPPFFAYFQKALATIAFISGFQDILILQKGALSNSRVLHFQRLSVIVADAFYVNQLPVINLRNPFPRIATFIVLSCNVGLILVDNIHFQYNSMLTALLILSIYSADRKKYLMSALIYCVLLNFKHIYLYYAPAYVVFFLRCYFFRGLKLTASIAAPLILSFGRFLTSGGYQSLLQILSRLFPISRGLTHAYWAPNFWAIYNVIDLFLYRVLSIWRPELFSAPTYCSGIVQVYSHSVLPSITSLLSLACVCASLTPLFFTLLKRKVPDLCTLLSLSAFSFFWLGYHVHEKALLLIVIPLLCLAFTDPKFMRLAVLFSIITATSLFPLLFTTFEIYIKYILSVTYIILLLTMFRFVLFAEKLIFLPLMMISVYNALGVMRCYIWLILLVFSDDVMVMYKKKRCELIEALIKEGYYPVQAVDSYEEIELVGGIDISTSKKNPDFAVVSFSVFEYPNMQLLAIFDDVVIVEEPYITDYLAVREATPFAELVNRVVADHPQFRPDVIICDGNGQFHVRGCGLACHVGALTGIATVGVAKNLNLSLFQSHERGDDETSGLGSFQEHRGCSEENKEHPTSYSDGYAPFNVTLPTLTNITRLGGSKVPVYVSTGYGIQLDFATKLVISTAQNRTCEPIRSADLHSREKIREYFDH